jgi:WD40 repeat protein
MSQRPAEEPTQDIRKARKAFGARLALHLASGTIPGGRSDDDFQWSDASFAAAVGVSDVALRAWLRGDYPPVKLARIEVVLFGKQPKLDDHVSEFERAELDKLWRAARAEHKKELKVKSSQPDKPSSISPAVRQGLERTRIDVARRIAELPGPIYGRAHEYNCLDVFLEHNERGLAVVMGPAGAGKSAFLAYWLRHRQSAGDVIVRHFVSRNYRGTTDPLTMLQHLAFQLAENGVAMNTSEIIGRTNTSAVLDDLVRALEITQAKRLIIAIDGLDELDSRLPDHFVRETLAQNIFIIVSCRASEGEEPPYLSLWTATAKRGIAIESIRLNGLDEIDVENWYRESFDLGRTLSDPREQEIVDKLHRLTGGLPLLLQHVFADERFVARDADIASLIFKRSPSSFREYVQQEFDQFAEELGREWTRPIRLTLALLTKVLAPISIIEVRAFLRHLSSEDGSFAEVPELNYIDDKLRRWLSVRMIDGRRYFSLTHPRFAETFSELVEIECADIDATFVPWLTSAWRTAEEAGSNNVASYALDWLPTHLSGGDHDNQRLAGHLLSSPTFLKAQALDPRYCSRRLRSTIDAWSDWRLQDKYEIAGAGDWTTFWAENEEVVFSALDHAQKHGVSFAAVIQQVLGDAAVKGSDQRLLPSLSMSAQPIVDQALLRTISAADSGHPVDIELLPNCVATLGRDGDMFFWTYNGSRIGKREIAENERGDAYKWYEGFRNMGDLFVRWRDFGEIEFVNFHGKRFDTKKGRALYSELSGMLTLQDLIVAWSGPSLQFWTKTGEWVAGSKPEDHRSYIMGVLPLGDRLASFACDGAICFWDLSGNRIGGGEHTPHADGLFGLIRCDDHLLSWGRQGSVRYWSLAGEPIEVEAFHLSLGVDAQLTLVNGRLLFWNADKKLYSCDINGRAFNVVDDEPFERKAITEAGDVLIDWGRGGVIFRSMNGKRLEGSRQSNLPTYGVSIGERHAVTWGSDHYELWRNDGSFVRSRHMFYGIDEYKNGSIAGGRLAKGKLITWGNNGLQFWNLEPNSRDQSSWIDGVALAGDRFVTWGRDGSVRFWSLSGERLPGGNEAAHDGAIACAVALRDRIVTWSEASCQRRWTLEGDSLSETEERVSDLTWAVEKVERVGNGAVSKGLEAISFWDEQGRKTNDVSYIPQINEGFIVLGERVALWRGRSLEFWDQHGRRVEGGDDRAHAGPIADAVLIGERLLTWEEEGILRIWSRSGKPEKDAFGCGEELRRVIPCPNYFVGWGKSKVMFFSLDGAVIGEAQLPRPWPSSKDYLLPPIGFFALQSMFVSWHEDDRQTIRFWTIDSVGNIRMKLAHHLNVSGMLSLGDCLVSWGEDGALRFWSLDGQSLGRDIENAHGAGRVRDVVLLDDVFASLGNDGTIIVWRFDGTAITIIAPPCAAKSIAVVNDRLLVCGLALWVYSRQAIGSTDSGGRH